MDQAYNVLSTDNQIAVQGYEYSLRKYQYKLLIEEKHIGNGGCRRGKKLLSPNLDISFLSLTLSFNCCQGL